jgi:branched-chain amino acid transport system substrate-binding protein
MPRNRLSLSLMVTLTAFAVFTSSLACATAADAGPGVSDTEVVLGGTHPFSGPASAYSVIDNGIEAYFAYVNDRGGVNGRKITYKDLDDAYSPPQALQLARQLVEQDHVFAIFNSLGTAVNIALRPYLNDNKVPQLFISTGASTWGADAQKFPWTIGFQPDYQTEALIYGRNVSAHQPNAKVAVLYQNDDFGRDYLTGFQRGLGSNQIIKSASYEVSDPDVRSQVAALKASGADTLLIAATPKFATQALVAVGQLGWKASTYLTYVSATQAVMHAATQQGGAAATEGVVTTNYLLDPSNAAYANTKGMKLYKQLLAKYQPNVDASNFLVLYGMAVAYTMVDTLQRAGKDLTREKVMDLVLHLNERDNPFVLPGVVVLTSPTDRFPIRQEQLLRYVGESWQPFGPVIDSRK